MTSKATTIHRVVMSMVLVYLFIPLLATFLYSIATDWYRTILPEGYTLRWYVELYRDPRFLEAIMRTLWVTLLAVGLSVMIMVPTVYVVTVYLPKWERLLQVLVTLPYALPGVVAAVGLLKIYSDVPFAISGTIWIILGAYFIVVLPYMFQGIRNSLRSLDAVVLVEAAEILGSNRLQAFVFVVLPNILPGVIVSVLLAISVLFGEFVLANMLAGGQYELLQVYLMEQMSANGHISSAVVITYFILVSLLSAMLMRWMRKGNGQ